MKRLNKIAVCLAGGLALNAGLRAETAPTSGNPYALVVTRNIFGLNPPVPVEAPSAPVEPPVKIMPNGIMNVFGKLQVLFKVAGKAPGKDDAYMLTEGQGKDDIEVIKIDEKAGMVTFNNHGVMQVLPLVSAPTSSLPAAATAAVVGSSGIPGAATSGTIGAAGFNAAFGSRPAAGISAPATANAGANAGNVRPIATRNNTFIQQPQTSLSPAEQTVVIEVNREMTKKQVLEGSLPPLPPTELTPSDATSVGGAPLVTPSPTSSP